MIKKATIVGAVLGLVISVALLLLPGTIHLPDVSIGDTYFHDQYIQLDFSPMMIVTNLVVGAIGGFLVGVVYSIAAKIRCILLSRRLVDVIEQE